MELYVKFMFTLTAGLVGVGLVMLTVIETLFSQWDPVSDVSRWLRQHAHGRPNAGSVRAEDILSDIEARRSGRHAAPSRTLDRRREVLRDLAEAESRASSPRTVEAL
jgi:hypothetical protein